MDFIRFRELLDFIAEKTGLDKTQICEQVHACIIKSRNTRGFVNCACILAENHGVKVPEPIWRQYSKHEIDSKDLPLYW
nr:hypothetical protein [Candidatus Sigynarchaeota archaeon]